ncbi:unnamed protein product [Peronospora belbahrii]|uniref:Calmodulin-lysine N-methyltransferase n=1 Tax=Peronospora belbahrii TaxID=622444 RepID=A0ABN8D5M1_9STRA|nr:unnamed protein product [Peronospora belbahrii]
MTRTETTRRHWRVLRNALLHSTSNETCVSSTDVYDTTASSVATDFFSLYQKTEVDTVQLLRMHSPLQANFTWMVYDVPVEANKTKKIYVHEKRNDIKPRVSMAELLSHQVNHGVDNTGNIRTWPSEQVLLSYLLSSNVCLQVQRRDATGNYLPITCCELGSGMAGLASLGLLACPPVKLQRIVVTDGNPLSVKNLQLCIEENKIHHVNSIYDESVVISTELLRWDRNVRCRKDLEHQFDLVFASDCLFFEDFHQDLAYTIKSLLRPKSGRCLLLQPRRNGSMERFSMIAKCYGFSIQESRDYDPHIVCQHVEYQQTRCDYVCDVHYPVLLTLTLDNDDE